MCWYPDVFRPDPNYLENEEAYKSIKEEVLGEESDESGSEEDEGTEESEEESAGNLSHCVMRQLLQFWSYICDGRSLSVLGVAPVIVCVGCGPCN